MSSTREMIRDFNVAFGRPVNEQWTELTVSERELLGKLLLEETLEYCVKGLGLKLSTMIGCCYGEIDTTSVDVELAEGNKLDPVECIDGLADVNVVAHFCAHWHGFNLDVATEIVNDSNMSKLGEDGKAIINGVTPWYRTWRDVASTLAKAEIEMREDEPGFDPSKPIGKILKGPNFWEPTAALHQLILEGHNR